VAEFGGGTYAGFATANFAACFRPDSPAHAGRPPGPENSWSLTCRAALTGNILRDSLSGPDCCNDKDVKPAPHQGFRLAARIGAALHQWYDNWLDVRTNTPYAYAGMQMATRCCYSPS